MAWTLMTSMALSIHPSWDTAAASTPPWPIGPPREQWPTRQDHSALLLDPGVIDPGDVGGQPSRIVGLGLHARPHAAVDRRALGNLPAAEAQDGPRPTHAVVDLAECAR